MELMTVEIQLLVLQKKVTDEKKISISSSGLKVLKFIHRKFEQRFCKYFFKTGKYQVMIVKRFVWTF